MSFSEELTRAVSILEDYGQTEDALWYSYFANIHVLGSWT